MRWRSWHYILTLKRSENFRHVKCCWCNKINRKAHIISGCKKAMNFQVESALGAAILPSIDQWSQDWVGDGISASLAIKDLVITTAKWALWKAYCNIKYGKGGHDNNVILFFRRKLKETCVALMEAEKDKEIKYRGNIRQLTKSIYKTLDNNVYINNL